MTQKKGRCKHGEFILTEGCKQCIAEKFGKAQETVRPERKPNSEIQVVKQTDSNTMALIKAKPEQDIEVKSFYEEALRLKVHAEGRVIAIMEDLKPATDDLSIIARVKKALEEKRKEYVKPLQDHIKEINDAFKILMLPIEEADRITRKKMLNYQQEQEERIRRQEEINRKRLEAAEEERKLTGEASQPVELIEVDREAPKTVSTAMGEAGKRDNWKYEVFDFTLLPNEYKVADTALLNSIAKKHHDRKSIPGVRFYNEPIIAVRTR